MQAEAQQHGGIKAQDTTASKPPSMMMPSSMVLSNFDASLNGASAGLTTEGMSELLQRMGSPRGEQRQHFFLPPTEEKDIFAAGGVTMASPTGGHSLGHSQFTDTMPQAQMESTMLGAPTSLANSQLQNNTNRSSPSQSFSSNIGSSMRRDDVVHFTPPPQQQQRQPQQQQPQQQQHQQQLFQSNGMMMATGMVPRQGQFPLATNSSGIIYLSPNSSAYPQQQTQSRETSVHQQYLSPTTYAAGSVVGMGPTVGLQGPNAPAGMMLSTPTTVGTPGLCVGSGNLPLPTPASAFEENYNVLSEDKQTMYSIPTDLIDTTTGSQKYLQQGASACYTFRFQLCRGYRMEGKCVHRQQCAFIHSRHVLHEGLASRVTQTQVHRNAPVPSLDKARYPRHPDGVALLVYDSMQSKNLMVDSGSLYVTHGSSAGYRAALADQQQQQLVEKEATARRATAATTPQQQQEQMQPPRVDGSPAQHEGQPSPHGASPEPLTATHSLGGGTSFVNTPTPSQQHPTDAADGNGSLLSSVRLQFCLHFDKSLCARGETCNFVHRILIEAPGAAPAGTGTVTATRLGNEMLQFPSASLQQHQLPPSQQRPSHQQHNLQQHNALLTTSGGSMSLSQQGGSMSLSQGTRPTFAPMGLHGAPAQSIANPSFMGGVQTYASSSPQPQHQQHPQQQQQQQPQHQQSQPQNNNSHLTTCMGPNGGSMFAAAVQPSFGVPYGQMYAVNSGGVQQQPHNASSSSFHPLNNSQQQQQAPQMYQQLQPQQYVQMVQQQYQQNAAPSSANNAAAAYNQMSSSGNMGGAYVQHLANTMPMNARTSLPSVQQQQQQQQQQLMFASYPPPQSGGQQQPLFATPSWAGLTVACEQQRQPSGPFDASCASRYF